MIISPDTHGALGWRPATSFGFARDIILQDLATAEIARVAQGMPVAFRRGQGGWRAVAVMGRIGGRNLYVTPDGLWRAGPVPPHAIRLHPFWMDADQRLTLRDDAVTEPRTAQGVEPFYANGALSPRLHQVTVFLRGLMASAGPVHPVLAGLESAGLLRPWAAPGEDTGILSANLFCLDARRFERLPDAQVLALFRSGALRWLHAHQDSLRHADRFAVLDRATQAPAAHTPRPSGRTNETAAFIAAIAEDLGDAESWDIISE